VSAIIAVVRYNGGADDLAWKFPSGGIGTWTKLIVSDSQVAVLMMNGQPFDSFSVGQHELTVDNIPVLNQALSLPVGTRSPLPVDIWYISKNYSMDVKWGTPAPIQVNDPKYNALIPFKAVGQFNVQFNDTSAVINKLFGVVQAYDKDSLITHFRGLCLSALKEETVLFLIKNEISIFEVNTKLDDFSSFIGDALKVKVFDCGASMSGFRVNSFKLSEDSPVVKQVNDAMARKAASELVGNEYVSASVPESVIIAPEPVVVPEPAVITPEPVTATNPEPVVAVAVGIAAASVQESAPKQEITPKQEAPPKHEVPPIHESKPMQEPAPVQKPVLIQEPAPVHDFHIPKTCPVCYFDLEQDGSCRECGHGKKKVEQEIIPQTVQEPNIPQPIITEPAVITPARSEPVASAQSNEPKPCAGCGTILRPTQKFCHKCGRKP
jgi:membrane protease subunit (stomatin/prohibitin family)